jgi:hypothetical protein
MKSLFNAVTVLQIWPGYAGPSEAALQGSLPPKNHNFCKIVRRTSGAAGWL